MSLFTKDQERDILEAVAYASLEQCHKGVGWVWADGRLHTKDSECEEDDDETCHSSLFGYELLNRGSFRGWWHKGLLTVRDRQGDARSVDDIPNQLYQHLMRKFKPSVGSIRIM